MSLGKWLAAAFCAAVLCVQSGAILATTRYHNRYWPFVNYPMYSRSHPVGQEIHHLRMIGRRCGSSDSVVLGAHEIGMMSVPLSDVVRRSVGLIPADSARAARSAERLMRLIQPRIPGLCALEVWDRSYTIGRDGLELPGRPPRLLRAWPLPGAS